MNKNTNLKGLLKTGEFKIGAGHIYSNSLQGRVVNIIAVENHPAFGKQYKIEGSEHWFESSCFKWVDEL
jgi:hypothetical protein